MFGENGISFRRLDALVRGLPLESLTMRALGAHAPGQATAFELIALDLAAMVVDVGSIANYYFVKANTKKGTHVPDPKMVPRVWRDTGEDGPKDQSTPAEVAQFFGSRMTVRYTPKEETDGG